MGALRKWDAEKERWQVKFASADSLHAYLQDATSLPHLGIFDEPSRLLKRDFLLRFEILRYASS